MTKQIKNRMISKKIPLARRPIRSSATLPMLIPRWRIEMTSAPKSCTAPMKSVPRTTQSMPGSQPQITAMAGPSIGAKPAIEA